MSIGRLTLAGLSEGQFRPLTREELGYLRKLSGLEAGAPSETVSDRFDRFDEGRPRPGTRGAKNRRRGFEQG